MIQFLQKTFWPFIQKIQYELLISGCIIIFSDVLYIIFYTPDDYVQGEYVKIMYIHVPSAWLSTFLYSLVAIASFIYLVWRNIVAFYFAKVTAYVGASFTIITLITGILWGKPIWGAWWVWDARLTSMLILFFFYLSYIFVYINSPDNNFTAVICSVLSIIGGINIPIVKFSVDFWNSLHQPASIIKLTGSTIHYTMLIPLVIMIIAFIICTIAIITIKLENLIIDKKIRRVYGICGY